MTWQNTNFSKPKLGDPHHQTLHLQPKSRSCSRQPLATLYALILYIHNCSSHRSPPPFHPASTWMCRSFGERRRTRSQPPHGRWGRAASAAIVRGASRTVASMTNHGWKTREPFSLRFTAIGMSEGGQGGTRAWGGGEPHSKMNPLSCLPYNGNPISTFVAPSPTLCNTAEI